MPLNTIYAQCLTCQGGTFPPQIYFSIDTSMFQNWAKMHVSQVHVSLHSAPRWSGALWKGGTSPRKSLGSGDSSSGEGSLEGNRLTASVWSYTKSNTGRGTRGFQTSIPGGTLTAIPQRDSFNLNYSGGFSQEFFSNRFVRNAVRSSQVWGWWHGERLVFNYLRFVWLAWFCGCAKYCPPAVFNNELSCGGFRSSPCVNGQFLLANSLNIHSLLKVNIVSAVRRPQLCVTQALCAISGLETKNSAP